MMEEGILRRLRGVVLLAAACGCAGETRPDGGAPPIEKGPEVKLVQHARLEEVEGRIKLALFGAAGGGAPASEPAYAEALAGATEIATGADLILESAPETLAGPDRLKFEGMVASLKERAAALQKSAEERQAVSARRAFAKVQESCTKCHAEFRPAMGS